MPSVSSCLFAIGSLVYVNVGLAVFLIHARGIRDRGEAVPWPFATLAVMALLWPLACAVGQTLEILNVLDDDYEPDDGDGDDDLAAG